MGLDIKVVKTTINHPFGGLEHEFYDFPFSLEFHHPN